jgi:hypothetical protein
MADIFLSHSALDESLARALAGILARYGFTVRMYREDAGPGLSLDKEEIDSARLVVAVCTGAFVQSAAVNEARRQDKLLLLRGRLVELPEEFRGVEALDLGEFPDWFRQRGLDSGFLLGVALRIESRIRPLARSASVRRRRWGLRFRRSRSPERREAPVLPGARSAQASTRGTRSADRPPEPVLLGASAPRQCRPGSSFTAVLVAYIEAARESAQRKLDAFGEKDHRVVTDVAPDRDACWRVGTPISVHLAGENLEITPCEVRFEWNGRENQAAFSVRVHEDAPEKSIELCFEVLVAGQPIAFIPLRLKTGPRWRLWRNRIRRRSGNQVHARIPTSAFASYSSKDSAPVGVSLSTLKRWWPALDLFQDCLDLKANEGFKPQLEGEIRSREVFLLYWSRNAAASAWVKWEYETARDAKGINAILPIPLEDPAIAPPPPELADMHLRDRFLMASYALAKVHEETAQQLP